MNGKPVPVEQRWSLPATPEAVPRLREAVGSFASNAGVLDPPLADVRLAVTEAVANVVIHSYREDPRPGQVEVAASYSAEQLRLVICDDGLGCAPRPDSPGLGLGIPIITEVADRVEFRKRRPRGTELHVCFTL